MDAKKLMKLGFIPLSDDRDVRIGTEVLIPKGVKFRSTHPTVDKGVTKRDLRIKVQTTSSKWTDTLTWAGAGSYWRWCKKTDCFYLPPEST